ncbi:hypothetical protein AN640_06665, partial [Candidatus Epulonipiscium fishelsonii]
VTINETPGIGLKAADEEFTSKFENLPVQTFSVTKDGSATESEIDVISGATQTTEAVVNGVNATLEYWAALKDGVTEGEFKPLAEAEPATDASEVYKVLFADADNFSAYDKSDKAEEILDSAGFTKNSITELISAKNGDEELGHIINVTAHDGFAGDIEFVVGITNDGIITGIEMVTINETPGIGLRAADEEFTSKFVNLPVQSFTVTKDGSTTESEIDVISGATQTTEAVVNGVNAVIEYWNTTIKDSTNTVESIEITDSAHKPVDSTDTMEPVETTDSTDTMEPVETTDSTDTMEPVETTDSTNALETTDSTNALETTDSTNALETTDSDIPPEFKALFADADIFLEDESFNVDDAKKVLDIAGFSKDTIVEVLSATDGDISLGKILRVKAQDGFVDDIEFVIGITNDGIITGVEMVTINETPGIGLKAADKEFTSKFVNLPVQFFTVTKDGSTTESEIDVISGATQTTEAVVNGVNAVIEYWNTTNDSTNTVESIEIIDGTDTIDVTIPPELKALFADANIFLEDGIFNIDDAKKVLDDAGFSEDTIVEVLSATDGDISLGKTLRVKAQDGFVDDIEFVVGITNDGIITGIEMVTINETPGIGLKAADKEFTSKFVNLPVQFFTVTKDGSTTESEIDVISGATQTTEAVVNGVNAAIQYWSTLTGGTINE